MKATQALLSAVSLLVLDVLLNCGTAVITLEFKLKGKDAQLRLVDEAIRTMQFVRNKCLRFWIDNPGVKLLELNKHCAVLAQSFEWAKKLNSQARQAASERVIFAVQRLFENCKKGKPGKKGYPQFQKNCRSVEYKTTGWKLTDDRKRITFSDGFGIGKLKLVGSRDLHFYPIEQIKRVRIVRRSDGYYCQFCIAAERRARLTATGSVIGLDVGLNQFYTDSNGDAVANPRYLRKSERRLKMAQRRVSRKRKGSANRRKAVKRLGRKHLKVTRQRKDFAAKAARCVVASNDVIVLEDLQVRNMVRNHRLAKSISDAAWSEFRRWIEHFGKVFGRTVIAVPPHYTSQNCSSCGSLVKKSLSVRTHICSCGCVLDRDHNAALNILAKGLERYRRADGNATLGERLTAVGQGASHVQ